MQPSSVASWHVCYYPIPNRFASSHHLRLSNKRPTLRFPTCSSANSHIDFRINSSPASTATHSCSSDQEGKKKKPNDSYPHRKLEFLEELYSSSEDNGAANQTQKGDSREGEEEGKSKVRSRRSNSSNMWWAKLKAALGQRINLEGIVTSVAVIAKDQHLALPQVAVQDIRYIDWADLKKKGFQGVVFDKDNTLTVPYSLTLWGPLRSSMEECKSVFGNDIAVFSNSAGLSEFDPDERKARLLERSIGIKVIRHKVKKPAGTSEEIEKHFGCESSRLIMVGDRPFTDIVYGNRNGFLTILTGALSLTEEPFIVQQVRKLELALVKWWSKRGKKATCHRLLPDATHCVKDLPPL